MPPIPSVPSKWLPIQLTEYIDKRVIDIGMALTAGSATNQFPFVL